MGPHFSQVGGAGLIHDRRTKIPLAMWCGQKIGGGDRDGNRRQRLEGCRHKLRDTQGPQRLQEAGKALRRARGPVSPDHTLISGRRDRANECRSKSARVRSPAARPRTLHSGSLGTGAARSSLHLHRPLCGCGGLHGSLGAPPVSPGSWDGRHPARVWPAPSRGSTEMSREEQAGCCPHHRPPPCESSLSGPALTPCPRPLASTSSQMQWALRHPTPPWRPPAQPQSRGTPVGFPGSHTSPDLISWTVSLWDDWAVPGRPVSGVPWAESGRGAGIENPFLAWGEWLELLQPQSPHL